MSLSITFWGTRGTIPVPGARTTRYGGNTSCVAVRDNTGRCLVLDAGTGIRGLGAELRKAAPSRVDVLLSHVHWDHIQGMPFFPLLYADGSDIRIHGPTPAGVSLQSVLERQMDPAVFPVPPLPARRGSRSKRSPQAPPWKFPASWSNPAGSPIPAELSASRSRRQAVDRRWPT